MRSRPLPEALRRQAGFSMVEMLMAAFILAIGILGLSMLQTMSLKSSRGSQSLATAVKLADRTMDAIELEGRLSWLNVTDTSAKPPEALTTLQYVGMGADAKRYMAYTETLDTGSNIVNLTPSTTAPEKSTKPTISANLRYVLTVTETAVPDPPTSPVGAYSDYGVQVEFLDDLNQTGGQVIRRVNITRRILHG